MLSSCADGEVTTAAATVNSVALVFFSSENQNPKSLMCTITEVTALDAREFIN